MAGPYPNKNSRRYRDERRAYVSDTIRMRMTMNQSLEYLKDKGYESSLSTLERDKRGLESGKLKKVYTLMKEGFIPQHVDRILLFEFAERELMSCYREEESPYKRAIIMEKIIALQPYFTSYYEATKDIMEGSEEVRAKMNKYLSNTSKDLTTKNDNESIEIQQKDNLLSQRGTEQSPEGLDAGEREYRKNKERAIF